MGLTNSSANTTPVTFANFNARDGVFVTKDKATDAKTTYDQIRDVRLVSAKVVQDSYDGKTRDVLRLKLANTTSDIIVSFNCAAGVVPKLLALLAVADLSQPLGISARMYRKDTSPDWLKGEILKNDLIMMSVYQGGYLKPKLNVPDVVMVKVGNKEVSDTSARDAFTQEQIAALMTRLGGAHKSDVPHPESSAPAAGAAAAEDPFEDDIPF